MPLLPVRPVDVSGRLSWAALASIAVASLGVGKAHAQTERPLSRLERESVDEGLATLGLRPEPAPAGKVVGTIYVVNQEVFSRRDWYFQWFNIFHRTTRPDILQRELLFRAGQPYDEALVEESMRNLQSPPTVVTATGATIAPPELSSVVAIVPVAAPRAGTVDVLVVTRDVWSLRFNTDFEFQQNTLSSLDTSLSENNLFGWRKYLSFGFSLDLGKFAVGPTYFDPNIAGTRLQLLATALVDYTRGTNDYEGNVESLSFLYPLYSLASRWGAGLNLGHEDVVLRGFQGNALSNEPIMGMPGVTVPYIFRRRYAIVDAAATRSFGRLVIQRVTLGYRFDDRRSAMAEGAAYGAATPDAVQAFLDQYAPLSELRSEPYVQYDLFTAWYGIYRDLDTFDLRENARLGPFLSLRAAYGAPELGADFRAYPFGASAGWAVGPGGSYMRASATGALRLREGRAIDQTVQGKLYVASPLLARLLRVVVSAELDAVRADTHRTRYFLGGDTGLRGYVIGELQGTSLVVGHAELRSAPLALYSQRVGGLLFCDVGDAAPSLNDLAIRADVGLGLRWLIPQLNASVLRVDWAVPLRDGVVTPAGLPGRVSAGFQQIF
ncbi:MAG TPA: BamA/TamA family outer membrane protein [Polyangia bacterium]|nr:BamA/TamA family outer membrane protein [Polyangia bacterium]